MAGAALAFAAVTTLGTGCGASVPLRDCFGRVWVPASEKDVVVVGDFTGWTEAITPEPFDEQWSLARVALSPGEHGYMLQRKGALALDAGNPLTTFREDGLEVSLLLVPDCASPGMLVDEATLDGAHAKVGATFLAAESRAAIDPKSVSVTTSDGLALHVDSVDPTRGRIEASGDLPDGKHTLTIRARDVDGKDAELGHASLWPGRKMATWRDGILYQVMIDRFRGDGGAALTKPATPSSFAGGTLDGVRAALEDGYFDALGVTALWISPVYDNPEEARQGLDGHPQNAYHGYWPEHSRAVEPRFGGEDALRAVAHAAHARGISVLLDVVPNHVYEQNPVFTDRTSDAGFDLPGCVCGTPGCDWGDHILTCWFADYLPDVRYQDGASMRRAIDDTLFWTDGFDLDGVRIDAVPMMPRAVTRRLALALREATYPRDATFVLGEVFTGPGAASLGELRAHIGPNELDSVFDFPAMWAVRGAVTGHGGFTDLEDVLTTEEESFAGSGVVLARQVDNHDVTRLVSEAYGDAGSDPWAAPPLQPSPSEPYDRLELALATNFALPGLPLVWQGDEIGLAGGRDPDSRRVMPADAALSARQLALRARVGELAKLRACSSALRRGTRTTLTVDAQHDAFVRGANTDAPVLVALSASTSDGPIAIETGSLAGKRLVDALTGETFDVPATGSLSLPMKALSYRWLFVDGDPCVSAGP